MENKNEHYVYIHRDEEGDPIYVGRGKNPMRAVTHEGDDLSEVLAEKDGSVEIAGSFETLERAADVEAALISALCRTPSLASKMINKVAGVSRATFRPLGVPVELIDRIAQPEVDLDALMKVTGGKPALFVLIKEHDASDGRIGYDLANIPANEAIKDRMTKWWQLGKKINEWKSNPDKMPHVLIAVSGPIKHRVIVGCLPIDRNPSFASWKAKAGGLYEVPTVENPNNASLNYGNLRGRRMLPRLAEFGGVKSRFFDVVESV